VIIPKSSGGQMLGSFGGQILGEISSILASTQTIAQPTKLVSQSHSPVSTNTRWWRYFGADIFNVNAVI